jgi:hypothetical protein
MDYCAFSESFYSPSRTATGSLTPGHEERIVRMHAVRLRDGRLDELTVCGFRYLRNSAESLKEWAEAADAHRCRACAGLLGEQGGGLSAR